MFKTVIFGCCLLVLWLAGLAQVMPLPSMEEIRAELKKAHTDTGRADCMLDLALSYVFRPGEYKSDLDSALLWIKQAENINRAVKDLRIEAKIYFVYSNILREGGNSTEGHKYIERSLTLYRTVAAPSDMGEACLEESNYYSFNDKDGIRKRRVSYLLALNLFKQASNKLREADVLKNIGTLDDDLNEDRSSAMKELKEALAIYESIGSPSRDVVYVFLANLCHEEGDYPNMVRYCEMAVKYGEREGDTSLQMARIYRETAAAYLQLSNFEAAVTFAKKAIGIAKKFNDLEYFIPTTRSLCYALLQLGRTEEALQQVKGAEKIIASYKRPLTDYQQASFLSTQIMVYAKTKQNDQAASCAKEYVRLLKKHPATDYVYLFSSTLIGYFINTRQGKEAEIYADSNLQFSHFLNEKGSTSVSYLMKSRADSAIGDLNGALTNYQLYKKEMDSVLNETSRFQLAQLQVESETEKKDNAIKALQQQQELQAARLEHSRVTNIVEISGVAVLALLLALVYSRYRIKQRLNQALEQKQQAIYEKNAALERLVGEKDVQIGEKDALIVEKEWLVKEIHHRVKNNLEIVISLLNSQTEFLENPSALDAIRTSRERMEAIAIIHRKLYQTETDTLVRVQDYAYELVDNLQESFACARDIHFQLNIADIALDISQSVPLGLILNEAITNAIKYAYPRGIRGTVCILLQPTCTGRLELKIVDKGKGLPAGLDWKNSPSFGLKLINLLAEQLRGELYFINQSGLEIMLIFTPTRYPARLQS